MLYSLNKRAEITIQTPVGKTKEIEVKELVKQGTVLDHWCALLILRK